jgi:hypothetical protein
MNSPVAVNITTAGLEELTTAKMADSMLEVKHAQSPQKVTPNLLPCKIQHNGSVEPTASFWMPTTLTGTRLSARAAFYIFAFIQR